jgi:hypothetical protein
VDERRDEERQDGYILISHTSSTLCFTTTVSGSGISHLFLRTRKGAFGFVGLRSGTAPDLFRPKSSHGFLLWEAEFSKHGSSFKFSTTLPIKKKYMPGCSVLRIGIFLNDGRSHEISKHQDPAAGDHKPPHQMALLQIVNQARAFLSSGCNTTVISRKYRVVYRFPFLILLTPKIFPAAECESSATMTGVDWPYSASDISENLLDQRHYHGSVAYPLG